jgi:hypothetical protein
MKRITDLEKFSLEEIWRPYQSLRGFEKRLDAPPYNLGDTARMLKDVSHWSRCVLDRLHKIGFNFPTYIQHPLVDVIASAMKARDAGTICERCGIDLRSHADCKVEDGPCLGSEIDAGGAG